MYNLYIYFLNFICLKFTDSGLETKLRAMFGQEAISSLQETEIPELKWLLDIAMATDAANTDPET